MIAGSVCSGIGAPECAWAPLGWRSAFLSEIDPFPRAVLARRFPEVPLHGDFTTIKAGDYAPIDLLVGGTPCQSFSVAGLRGGMADARGNLALEYLRLAERLGARWLVWENVPGVLSSAGGRDFGAFLGGLAELGYGFAYRVLDAQHFGLAQRRARVFVVGYLGDWRRAAAVLFEPASLRGHPAPRREAGEGAAVAAPLGAPSGGGWRGDLDHETDVARCLTGHASRIDGETENFIPVDVVPAMTTRTGTGRPVDEHLCGTLQRSQTQAVAFNMHKSGNKASSLGVSVDRTDCLRAFEKSPFAVLPRPHAAVRRLTPRECERLQGFPDDWTAVAYRKKPAADGPRYKALGNSMAVPVLAWIGRRIAREEAATQAEARATAWPPPSNGRAAGRRQALRRGEGVGA